MDEVSTHMKNANIDAEVNGRVKHFFSIYKKMVNQDKTVDQIYDLFAVRIIVDSVKDCYAALELSMRCIHRYRDVLKIISQCRGKYVPVSAYDLMSSIGQPFEIQIRTKEMHKTAEYGIAAHGNIKSLKMERRALKRRKKRN